MSKSKYFFKVKDHLKQFPGVAGMKWAVFEGTNMTVVYYEIKAACINKPYPHSHEEWEQMSLPMGGGMDQFTGDERKVIRPGQLAWIPKGVWHDGRNTGEDFCFFDVFSPPRPEYVAKYNNQ